MKQTYPVSRGNRSVGGNKLQPFSSANESGTRQQFYRSIIMAVSGSLLCVAASENAVAQSAGAAPQTPGQMLGETAEISQPPTVPGALDTMETAQWPTQVLEPNLAPSFASDLPATLFPTSSVNVNYDGAVSVDPGAGTGTDANASADANANAGSALPAMPTVNKRELSASGDFMYGTGTISVPIGFGLKAASLPGASFPVSVITADRSTVYYGGTLSFSPDRIWYLDISGEDGRSTGSTSIGIPNLLNGSFPANFDYNDTWYQVYLRYTLKNFLAGTGFQAYLRGGVSLVKATLDASNDELASAGYGPGQFYKEHDNTFDVLGNFGFGLTYALPISTFRAKYGLQLEGEGFAGNRSQDITETYASTLTGSTTINNTVYGAIGRLTVHAEYRLGHTGHWKVTGDAGMMTKYSFVDYAGIGTKDELLWGPYVKVGASFVF